MATVDEIIDSMAVVDVAYRTLSPEAVLRAFINQVDDYVCEEVSLLPDQMGVELCSGGALLVDASEAAGPVLPPGWVARTREGRMAYFWKTHKTRAWDASVDADFVRPFVVTAIARWAEERPEEDWSWCCRWRLPWGVEAHDLEDAVDRHVDWFRAGRLSGVLAVAAGRAEQAGIVPQGIALTRWAFTLSPEKPGSVEAGGDRG
jgi:hypothetical protein